jgi:hypothetical protein
MVIRDNHQCNKHWQAAYLPYVQQEATLPGWQPRAACVGFCQTAFALAFCSALLKRDVKHWHHGTIGTAVFP